MSSMAKIFVVVNLVLVVAVFGSAATLLGAQDDWKKALTEAQTKAAEIQSVQVNRIKQAELRVQTQTAKAAEQQSRADDAEDRLQIAKAELDKAAQINAQISGANEKNAGELGALRKLLEAQQATVAAARSEANDANGKFQDAFKSLEEETRNRAELEGRVQELDDSTRTLQAQGQDLQKQVRQLQFWIQQAKKDGYKGGIRERGSNGQVLEIRDVAGGGMIVIISVGSDDGVAVGDEYRISRGSSFVGFAKITRVYKDKAVGEFDTKFKGPGAPPQQNDRAYVN